MVAGLFCVSVLGPAHVTGFYPAGRPSGMEYWQHELKESAARSKKMSP